MRKIFLFVFIFSLILISSSFAQINSNSFSQSPIAIFSGAANGDSAGQSIAVISDINSDGYSEIAAGAPSSSNGDGAAYLYDGKTGTIINNFYSTSQNAGGYFGFSIDSLGDINGDGLPEIIIGEPFSSVGSFGGAGKAFIYEINGNLLYELNGAAPYENFGFSVANAEDVNGDNINDIVIGARGYIPPGKVYVFNGADGSLIYQITGSANLNGGQFGLGSAVMGLGDLNGDGYSEIAAGAPYQTSTAFVYSGNNGAQLASFTGPSGFGNIISNIGDFDNDGTNDFAIGSSQYSGGMVRIYSGSSLTMLNEINGQIGDQFISVSGGDINFDGFSDVIIAVNYIDSQNNAQGKINTYLGPNGNLAYTWNGISNGVSNPISTIVSSHYNNDGLADIVYGSADSYGNSPGNIVIHSLGGAWQFGNNNGVLNLAYTPNSNTPGSGTGTISGAAPFTTGYLAWSTSPTAVPLPQGDTLVVDLTAGQSGVIPITFDSNGQVTFPSIGFNSQLFSGTNVYFEAFALKQNQPTNQLSNYDSSNGMKVGLI